MTKPLTILLVGSGGRESAIAWKLGQSPQQPCLICAPGNGGTPFAGLYAVDTNDRGTFQRLLTGEHPDLVFFGGETPLIAGDADLVRDQGILAFGPSKKAAIVEASKVWMKDFCVRNGLPTAPYKVARDRESAFVAIDSFEDLPVLKADGVCGGKGVILPQTIDHAYATADAMLSGSAFGEAGKVIVIEKRLLGVEYSVTALTDGTDITLLPVARDYKRAKDGDKGLNTGGMGAVAPMPNMPQTFLAQMEDILLRAVRALKAEGREYRGALYAGFMVEETEDGPVVYLLEFNCRLGDPETQVMLPVIESDLLPYVLACARGEGLAELGPLRLSGRFAVGITLASEGYPERYATGMPFIDDGKIEDTLLFHAGTQTDMNGGLKTTGGRVATAVGLGDTVEEALMRADLRERSVHFRGKYRRTDIAAGL